MSGDRITVGGHVRVRPFNTRENVAVGDPAGQAEQVMRNIERLLGECGAALEHIVSCHVYLTDIRHREPVYRVLGDRLAGVHPCSPDWSSPPWHGRSGWSR